jgi:response regulator RpfG family c-di-GMP phosphodiesterase
MSKSKLYDYIVEISDYEIKKMVKFFVEENLAILQEQPASLSGKFHNGETLEKHLIHTCYIADELTIEFNLSDEEYDIVMAACMLHDIGSTVVASKEKDPKQYQRLYDTGYYRSKEGYELHANIGAAMIGSYIVNNKTFSAKMFRIKKLVEIHMSHWLNKDFYPNDLLETIICTADFIATRPNIKIEGL